MCFLCGNLQEDKGSIASEESQGIAVAFGWDDYRSHTLPHSLETRPSARRIGQLKIKEDMLAN